MSRNIHSSLKKLMEGARYGVILREGIKTAIVGRPNVGKSSLLNALLENDRAIVTELPGTTRDVIEEYLNIKGIPVRIMDTAGIRNVRDIAEKEGVRRSLNTMKDADLVLLVLDGSSPLHDTDADLIRRSDPQNTIIVINKTDLPRTVTPDSLPGSGDLQKKPVNISAKKGTGLNRLKDKIVEFAREGQKAGSADTVTNVRHIRALERTSASLDAFMTGVKEKTSPEFLSIDLRDALDAIGEIQGITTPDDILNRIFSNFCIGK
jgi:tRNA modification GTPase